MSLLEKITQPLVNVARMFFGEDTVPHFETEVLPGWIQALGYLENHALYWLDNQSVGFAFIGSPLSGASPASYDKLAGLLQGQMPVDSVMQFILWASPDMEGTLTRYKSDRLHAKGEFLRANRDAFCEFYRDGATHSVVKGTDIRLRDAKLVITGKVPLSSKDPDEEELRKVAELRDIISAGLKACDFRMEILKPAAYLRFMQTIFNWGPDAAWRQSPITEYAPELPLTEQVLDFNNEVRVDEHGLWFGSHRVRVLSPKRFPQTASFGQAYSYLGDVSSGTRGLRDPTLITMNLWFKDRESEEASVKRETMWLTNQSGQAITRFRPEILDQKASFDLASKQISEGDRIIRVAFNMAIITPDEKTSLSASSNARSYMREFGFHMMEDRYISAPLFGHMIPFGTDVQSSAAIRRWRRFTTRGIVPLLPIMSEWRGTGTPTLLTISRNGQLMGVSNWDSETSFNAAIAAESGSGKSFLAQTLALNARMTGSRFWIIDKGKSYRNIVELLDGQRMTFGKDSTLCLNPFSIVDDYDEVEDLLFSLVAAMAAINDPLLDFQVASGKRIMRETFQQVGRDEMKVDHLAEALIAQEDGRLQDLGRQLHPFTKNGGYGRLFHGKNNFDADNPIILLELDDLEGRFQLQRVVLLQLMFQIRRDMLRLPRSLQKYLLIDEAWELLSGNSPTGGVDPVADFVGKAYRQFRKAGGSAFTITQSIADFQQNDVTRAIWENSPHKWLLGQRPEAIEAAKREGWLEIGDHGFRLLRGVHTVKGEYSEIFLYTPYGYGVGRLIVPPLARKLFSTTGTDVERILQLRQQGKTLEEAVAIIAREDGMVGSNNSRAA